MNDSSANGQRPTANESERCYLAALRILDYRFNSAAELRRKLAAKKFERPIIDATLSRLHDEKWLDDERFAAAYVRTRMQKQIGRARVRRELTAAGVGDEVAARAIGENVDADAERANLAAVCAKKRRALERRHGAGYAASGEGKQKLIAQLLRQGYHMDEIREALKN